MNIEAVRHDDGSASISVFYSQQLYDTQIIENFAEQFLLILGKLTPQNKAVSLSEISVIPEQQRKQILVDFSGKVNKDYKSKTIVTLLREAARVYPDNKAVMTDKNTLTYKEFDKITDDFSIRISSENKNRKPIGIIVGRSENMPICAVSVMKSGAAYLPLDPTYPSERLEFMLADSGAEVLIADKGLEKKMPSFSGKIIFTDEIYTPCNAADLPVPPKPEDVLILLYTSGTTGKPKGVMLAHAGLVSYLISYKKIMQITSESNVAAYASFGFDANMMDMYSALSSGACLHIIPEEMRLDMPAMAKFFNERNIDAVFLTTQIGRQILTGFADKIKVRAISTGGETLVPFEIPDNIRVYNVYGPTETTVIVTFFEIDKPYNRVPLGKPTENTAIYIVDKYGNLLPPGAAGELLIAGCQVGLGYLNRPDLTAEKFVKNPFTDDPDYARVYRTGDIARFLPDGNVDFIGRNDFQVKIRGFRIELPEIEMRIRDYPGMKDAAVLADDNPSGGKRVIAYIVSDKKVDIKALNDFIEEKLPSYMIPAATMQIEKIPLNQNGKVDRKSLPHIQANAEDVTAPRNAAETLVRDVMCEIMGEKNISVTANLLQMGLDSLSAIRAGSMITEKSGTSVTAPKIMRLKTIEKIAELLNLDTQSEKKQEIKSDAKTYPLTSSQMGIYFACVKNPGSLEYNVPFCIYFDKSVNAEKLANAATEVINAHPLGGIIFMVLLEFFHGNNRGFFLAPYRNNLRFLLRTADNLA
jgi:amino acid adenylation domain-containing protein